MSITEISGAEFSPRGEGSNHNFSENVHSDGQEGDILPLSTPESSDIPSRGDNHCENWLQSENIIGTSAIHPGENTENAGEFSETNIEQDAEDLLAASIPRDGLLSTIPGASHLEQTIFVEMESGINVDPFVLEPDQSFDPIEED